MPLLTSLTLAISFANLVYSSVVFVTSRPLTSSVASIRLEASSTLSNLSTAASSDAPMPITLRADMAFF